MYVVLLAQIFEAESSFMGCISYYVPIYYYLLHTFTQTSAMMVEAYQGKSFLLLIPVEQSI